MTAPGDVVGQAVEREPHHWDGCPWCRLKVAARKYGRPVENEDTDPADRQLAGLGEGDVVQGLIHQLRENGDTDG